MNKTIIINLIAQDMKHTVLVQALQTVGFDTKTYELEIIDSVYQLMGGTGDPGDLWLMTYYDYMGQAPQAKSLNQLANRAYEVLHALPRQ